MRINHVLSRYPACTWLGFLPRAEGILVPLDQYASVCALLAEEPAGYHLASLTATDWIRRNIFEVTLHLRLPEEPFPLWLKAQISRTHPTLPSVTSLWASAHFLEREAYDLFGIVFEGHPNLKRILSPDGEESHPLRKDFTKEDNETYGEMYVSR